MEANQETGTVIQGPYWDYLAASKYAARYRDMWARLTADAVLKREPIKNIRGRAAKYEEFQALHDRITARYDATKDDEVVSFIGWESSARFDAYSRF